jgi:hypothetical protein
LADKAKALFLLAFPAQLFSGNGRFPGWNLFFRSLPKRFFRLEKVPLVPGFPGMAFPGEISF